MILKLRITFTADWHIGAGYGRPGSIDRLLRRDEHDLPYVPAKTIRGMYRDACERLAFGLDEGQARGLWAQFVDEIFGSQPALGQDKLDPSGYHLVPTNAPKPTRFHVQPAHLHQELRASLTGNNAARQMLRSALGFVKPGVKIDSHTGRAADAHLRFEEQGRIGTVFDTTAELESDDVGVRHFLVAAAKLIDKMGGKRRRGAGACTVDVVDAKLDEALAWLAKNDTPPTIAPAATAANEWPSTLTTARITKVLPITITLHRPVAVAAATVGNVVQTLDFVPGTYLLPYFTKKLGSSANKSTIRGAIQSGSLQVANATLEVAKQRGLPLPYCFFISKGGKFEQAINSLVEPADSTRPKQLREGYVSSGEVTATLGSVAKVVSTHNVVHDQEQRPNEAVGGVYSYEAIASQGKHGPTVLHSELRVSEELFNALNLGDADTRGKLNGSTRLGSSKKDDYGLVTIAVGAPSVVPTSTDASGLLYVWLESDVLLRDETTLQFTPTIATFAQQLGAALGVPLPVRESDKYHSQSVRVRRIESWQTSWGLPRPTLLGLQAGSCFVFDLGTHKIAAQKLAEVQANGLGERRSEGFGRVRFNDALLREPRPTTSIANATTPTVGPPTPLDVADQAMRSFIHTVECEAWRTAIRRLALRGAEDNAASIFRWGNGKPPMSQLGGLRNAVQRLQRTEDKELVLGWLRTVQKNPRRAGKWAAESLKAITKYIEQPDLIWSLLKPSDGGVGLEQLTLLKVDDLKKTLWPYAVRAVFDAAIRAHKRRHEDKEKE